MIQRNDRVCGVLLLVLAVAYGWGATQFPEPSRCTVLDQSLDHPGSKAPHHSCLQLFI